MAVMYLCFKAYVAEQGTSYDSGSQNQAMKQKKENATRQQEIA